MLPSNFEMDYCLLSFIIPSNNSNLHYVRCNIMDADTKWKLDFIWNAKPYSCPWKNEEKKWQRREVFVILCSFAIITRFSVVHCSVTWEIIGHTNRDSSCNFCWMKHNWDARASRLWLPMIIVLCASDEIHMEMLSYRINCAFNYLLAIYNSTNAYDGAELKFLNALHSFRYSKSTKWVQVVKW